MAESTTITAHLLMMACDALCPWGPDAQLTRRHETKRPCQETTLIRRVSSFGWQSCPPGRVQLHQCLHGCMMRDNYYKVDFTGVSGLVRYSEDGTIIYTRIRLAQWRRVNVALDTYDLVTWTETLISHLVYDPGESDQTLYSEGYPPDGTPVAITNTYHTVLVVFYYFLAVVGITLSIVCLVFNFAYRKKKVIRLTTPLLNYIIVCGAIFMYVSVFFGVLPTIERAVVQMQCIVHVWAYGIGYLLVYGTILAKMWRVYQIFHDPTPNKMILKAWHLMCVVGTITGFGVLLIVAKTIAQALTSPQLVDDSEHSPGLTSSSVLEEYSVWQCYESGSIPFVLDLLIFVYLGLLQLVGIILAFQTRKVRIPF
ncbi:Gamma-aminobutyric acid type B receptor subunit 2 [Geodia barretti]|uniref:Gamma-aminobutyric acid type B receptor subunit 2 n=1 Tax=Geodia barretti TaxID=519541 RepID=A0AA35XAE2_GEOBA|nr:Gamma-aminobutyric acid type B receptor subunit 2 [Geodia barretti]